MSTGSEQMSILGMIEQGVITAEEGVGLLSAIEESNRLPSADGTPIPQSRWFRVRVTDRHSDTKKVNVNIPLSLVDVGLKIGARFGSGVKGVDLEEIAEAIRQGARGKIFDGEAGPDGERIEVFVE
jgi:hypothetical protein